MDQNAEATSILQGRAKEAYRTGRLSDALAAVSDALALQPTWPVRGNALQTQAIVLSELVDLDAAMQAWQMFFDELPTHVYPEEQTALAHHNYGYTLRMLRREHEALKQSRMAVPHLRRLRSPGLAAALHDLAWSACLNGDNDEARAALTEAAPLATEGELVYHQRIGTALLSAVSGMEEQAEAACLELMASEAAPRRVRSHACWVMGDLHLANGRLSEAAAMARQAEEFARGDAAEPRLLFDAQSLARTVARAAGQAG